MLVSSKVVIFGIAAVVFCMLDSTVGSRGNRQRAGRRSRHQTSGEGNHRTSGPSPHPACEDDEYLCPPTSHRRATCIPTLWVCDNDIDCPGRQDEDGCAVTCADYEFNCGDGNCIPSTWRCDGDNDCSNGADENTSLCPSTTTEAP